MRRFIDFLDSLLNILLSLSAVIFILISAYSLWDNYQIYQTASDKSILAYKPTTASPADTKENDPFSDWPPTPTPTILPPLTEDYVFWLTVDGTLIDYPVMQGDDNWEYLNKSATGEFSLSGAIFLDSSSDANLTDDFSIIYGHHMAYNAMFGSLDNYLYKDYYNFYRTGSIITPDTAYDLNIFAVTYADGTDTKIYYPHNRSRSEILNYLRPNAEIWEEPEPGLPIIGMSTCVSYENSKRLIVLATIKERADGSGFTPVLAEPTETAVPEVTGITADLTGSTVTPTAAITSTVIVSTISTKTPAMTNTPTAAITTTETVSITSTKTPTINVTPAATNTLTATVTPTPTNKPTETVTPAAVTSVSVETNVAESTPNPLFRFSSPAEVPEFFRNR